MKENEEMLLSPYRILDLADEKGLLCGKTFADRGADVIKVERPGGDPARKIGPFYHDDPDPFWDSTLKRSVLTFWGCQWMKSPIAWQKGCSSKEQTIVFK